ncbi:MAG: SpoIIE family protein phosphatase [Bacteroidales bacterium]|nr:SpoIIE family protein phosphatase [Bacteroidales bacterium]
MHIRIKQILIVSLLALLPAGVDAQQSAQDRTAEIIAMPDGKEKLVALEGLAMEQTSLDSVLMCVNLIAETAEATGSQEYSIKAAMMRAEAFNKAYTYNKAISYYHEAIELCQKYGDSTNLGDCYNAIASNYQRINEYNSASEYYNKALGVFVDTKQNDKITDVYRNLGRQCVSFHLYETANNHFADARMLDSMSNNMESLGKDFFNIGRSDYYQFLDLDSLQLLRRGISTMRRAVEYASRYDSSQRVLMGCYEQLMLMYVSYFASDDCKAKDLAKDSAKYFYALTDDLRNKLNPHSQHIVIEITDANILTMEGHYNDAYQRLKSMEDRFDQGGSKYSRYLGLLYRSMIWVLKQSNKYKEAVEYSEKFKEVEESSYNREFAVKSTKAAAEAKYDAQIKRRQDKEREEIAAQKTQTNEQRWITVIFAICIILAAFLAFIIWKGLVRKRKNNNLLAQQKVEISQKNEELKIQNQKIMSQRDEIMSQRDEIESQRSQLSEANSRITASIRYAQRIQTAAVPSDEMMSRIFGGCLVYWKPLNIVSGDFFWATQAGKYKLLTAADCTGHGVPGAFMSMLGVSTLNDIAAQKDINGMSVSAADILDELREKIIAALRQSAPQSGAQDGIDMAFCIIDTENMELQFSGANRPLWIVRNGDIIEHKGDRMPVGYHIRKNAPFTNNIIKIQPGDVLYMFSDGITDQFGGMEENKCKYGVKRFRDLLLSMSQKPFDEQKSIMEDTMNQWRLKPDGSLESQLDDQIVVGVRI